MKLKLNKDQAQVIFTYLAHTRLGKNKYTEAVQDVLNQFDEREIDLDLLKVTVEFNNSEGLVFNIAGEEDGNPAGS